MSKGEEIFREAMSVSLRDGYPVLTEDHPFFIFDIHGLCLPVQRREHLPEPIVRMPVIESQLPGPDRRKRSEDQHSAAVIK